MAAFDAVIVGGGPAGATAARVLASGGARVCLLEGARVPRPKPCGGALSPRVLAHLPDGVESLVRARIHRAVFTYRLAQPFEIASPDPMGYLVCRDAFDAWLLGCAAAAGATVRDGSPVRAVERGTDGISIRVADEILRAPIVIGADGPHSLVAAACLPPRPPLTLLGLHAEVPWDGEAEQVHVDLGAYPGGYAWAFPGGDRVNLGVMGKASHGRALRQAWTAFGRGTGRLSPGTEPAPVAAPVAAASLRGPWAMPGVLLVGDAGRLVDPFLGEGIFGAVRSGALAAAALLAGPEPARAAAAYEAAVATQLWPDVTAAARLAWLFHRLPGGWYRALSRRPEALHRYAAVLTGEQSYAGFLGAVRARLEGRARRWTGRRPLPGRAAAAGPEESRGGGA
jgi:geranylgeranyl reductase family protein